MCECVNFFSILRSAPLNHGTPTPISFFICFSDTHTCPRQGIAAQANCTVRLTKTEPASTDKSADENAPSKVKYL